MTKTCFWVRLKDGAQVAIANVANLGEMGWWLTRLNVPVTFRRLGIG